MLYNINLWICNLYKKLRQRIGIEQNGIQLILIFQIKVQNQKKQSNQITQNKQIS